ncbi:DoxX family protein [Streptomyces sp. NPDC091215]|uniref:DoxX family protein n=1 Tax=Streptomyces sp. NPDC091215 TaxID=3155192 RepID=UPI003437A1B9
MDHLCAVRLAGVRTTRSPEASVNVTPEEIPPGLIKTIGLLELLAAIGLILPAAVDIATDLVPPAASGLALTMFGAAITHSRRGEAQSAVVTAVLLALSVLMAYGRFGPHAF